ncbi:hypothetical protein ES703_117557 [subsurface metagenome]
MKDLTATDIKAAKRWREVTKGLTRKEKKDFAKWLDEIKH